MRSVSSYLPPSRSPNGEPALESLIAPAGMSVQRAWEIAVQALESPTWTDVDVFEDLGHLYQVRKRRPRAA